MGQKILQSLNRDHERIGAILALVEKEIAYYDDDDAETDLSLLADALSYLASYPEDVHHPLEEHMFDLLEGKIADQEAKDLQTIRRQHSLIYDATKKLRADIESILNDIVVPIERLKGHLQDYVRLQRDHMMFESSVLFPAAERALDDVDWQALSERSEGRSDPLFEQRLDKFETLYRYIADEAKLA